MRSEKNFKISLTELALRGQQIIAQRAEISLSKALEQVQLLKLNSKVKQSSKKGNAFGQKDHFVATFSDFGNPPMDYREAGVDIRSLYNDGGVTGFESGTSFAAPHIAGILLMEGAVQSGSYIDNDLDGNPDIIGIGD